MIGQLLSVTMNARQGSISQLPPKAIPKIGPTTTRLINAYCHRLHRTRNQYIFTGTYDTG
jgi:hypothetical protein